MFFAFCFFFFVFVFCFLLFVFFFLLCFSLFVFCFCFLLFVFCFFVLFLFLFFFLLFAFCFLFFVFCFLFLFFVFVFLQTNLLRKTNRLVPLRTSEETILFNFIEKRNRKTGEFAVSTRNSYKRLFFACLLPLTSGYIKALNVSSPWKQSVSFLSNGNNQSRFPRV